jgi:hypothetical protein
MSRREIVVENGYLLGPPKELQAESEEEAERLVNAGMAVWRRWQEELPEEKVKREVFEAKIAEASELDVAQGGLENIAALIRSVTDRAA